MLYLFSWVFFLLLFSSCSDDFLTEKPTMFVSPSNFYLTQEEAQLVLTGVYDGLQISGTFQQYGYMVYWGDMGVDIEAVPSWGPVYGSYNIQATDASIETMWKETYAAIQRTNIAISRIGQMDESLFDEVTYGNETLNTKAVLLGEASFIRALYYFYAEMIWGNIPLVLEETTGFGSDTYVPQSTPAEVYARIIADLEFAETNLPWVRLTEEAGRATKGAAKSLLGNVYLQMTGFPLNQTDKFDPAIAKFREVIDKAEGEGLYELLDNYADVFDYQNPNNKEIIFAVNFQTGAEGGWNGSLIGPLGGLENGGGYETHYVNHTFEASYDSLNDVRYAHNICGISVRTGLPLTNGQFGPWKYHKPKPNSWGIQTPLDTPVLRYADVLLKYAEALNGKNAVPPAEAYWAINKVRYRARHADHKSDGTVLPDLANLSKEGFLTALLQEDAWELCWEGKRKATLIRTGKLKEYITTPHYHIETLFGYQYYPGLNFREEYHMLYPIPQREMDINPNLVQNPGY